MQDFIHAAVVVAHVQKGQALTSGGGNTKTKLTKSNLTGQNVQKVTKNVMFSTFLGQDGFLSRQFKKKKVGDEMGLYSCYK